MLWARVWLPAALVLLTGCNRAKHAKCEAALVEMWGPQVASEWKDPAEHEKFKAAFMENCEALPSDAIDCVMAEMRFAGSPEKMDPSCEAKLKALKQANRAR